MRATERDLTSSPATRARTFVFHYPQRALGFMLSPPTTAFTGAPNTIRDGSTTFAILTKGEQGKDGNTETYI